MRGQSPTSSFWCRQEELLGQKIGLPVIWRNLSEMQAREFIEDLASKYGVDVVESEDSDMDVMLPEGKAPMGLLGELQKYGFKYYPYPKDDPTELHIHAPHRKEKSWYDRGWDWEIEGTKPGPIPGEQPYYGEDYLLGSGKAFSEN